jgi:hypothetical protein
MHKETIDERTKRVWGKIANSGIAGRFYLAGGTALAVHLGHRKYVDLDFFSQENFSTPELKRQLSDIGEIVLLGEADGTLHVTIDHVMVSFLHYGYGLLFPLVKFEGLSLADERDIAAMKLDAVSSRGSRKDFIDIYELLKKYTLAELIDLFEKKYAGIKYNMLHILKSLVYFDDAEGEPPPVMLFDANWDDMKQTISKAVSVFSKEHM